MEKLHEYNNILNKLLNLNNKTINNINYKIILLIIIVFIIVCCIINYILLDNVLNKYVEINYFNMHKLMDILQNNNVKIEDKKKEKEKEIINLNNNKTLYENEFLITATTPYNDIRSMSNFTNNAIYNNRTNYF
jgi:hypothetical protein